MGVRKVKNMKESTHIVRRIAPLDETGLVLLDQAMNYLFHTRSKNFSIDFQITWDKRKWFCSWNNLRNLIFLRINDINEVFDPYEIPHVKLQN